nr:hypothetical protein [Tanacetum cinerariifolium]
MKEDYRTHVTDVDVSEEFEPELARKRTTSKRKVKKIVTIFAKDNIITENPNIALELGKSISITEAKKEEAVRKVHATHARIVTETFPEPTRRKPSGVLDESIVVSATSSEGTGTKPGVLDEEKDISEEKVILEWGDEQDNTDDEDAKIESDTNEIKYKIYVYKDVDVEMAEPKTVEHEKKEKEEMTDAETCLPEFSMACACDPQTCCVLVEWTFVAKLNEKDFSQEELKKGITMEEDYRTHVTDVDVSEEFEPELARKRTTSKRKVKKIVTIFAKDNIITENPNIALELGKSISITEAEKEETVRKLHATHARIVTETFPDPTRRKPSCKAFSMRKRTYLKRRLFLNGEMNKTVSILMMMMLRRMIDADYEGGDHVSDTQDTDDEDAKIESDTNEIKYKIYVHKDMDVEMAEPKTVEHEKKEKEEMTDAAKPNVEKSAKEEGDTKKAIGCSFLVKEAIEFPLPSSSLSVSSGFIQKVHVLVISKTINLLPIPKIITETTVYSPQVTPIISTLQQTRTPIPTPLITTNTPTITTVVFESDALNTIQLRVAKMEKDVSKLKKLDLSVEASAALKTQVPTVVDEYLRSKVGDVFQRNCRNTRQILFRNEKQKMPQFTIKSVDKATLKEYDLKSYLYQFMHANKSFNRNPTNHWLYYLLMEALIEDENAIDKGVADTIKDHKRKHDDDDDDDDDDEEPSTGPNQGKMMKRRRTKESVSSKKPFATKETPKGKALSKGSKTGKSTSSKEPVEEPIVEGVLDDASEDVVHDDNQPQDTSQPKKDKTLEWLKHPIRPPTLDLEWNKYQVVLDQPEQTWFNQMVSASKNPLTSNDLMATLIDFSMFMLNALKIDNLTQDLLLGPFYKLLKGTCTSSIELKYNFQECFNALTEKLNWNNPGGDCYPFNMSKPLPLQEHQDMLLLVVQHKLFHLNESDIVDLIVALQMFIKSFIIKRQVKDLQLGVESYQKKLNITAPQRTFSGIELTPIISTLQQTRTPIPTPPITTNTPTITTVVSESDALNTIQLRVTKIEKDVSKLKKLDLSVEASVALKTQVPTVVDEYLRSKVGDVFQKKLQKHTADLIQKNPTNHWLYHLLMEALIEDENAINKGVADTIKDHKRKHDDDDDDDDDDEEPLAGPNQGKMMKRGRTKESVSSKKPSATKETPKGKALSKGSKTSKSTSSKEPVEEPIVEGVLDDAGEDVVHDDNQPQDTSQPKKDKTLEWLKHPLRPPTLDLEWNKCQVVLNQPEQTWFNQMVSASKNPLTSNDLMATLINFSMFMLNALKIDNLTQDLLLGPFYKLLKDMLLLVIQHKLFHLNESDIVDLIVALQMFIKSLIIKRQVKDLQLGVERYQKKLNITAPQRTFSGIECKELYTSSYDPPGAIYKDQNKHKRVMRADKLYKFLDETLKKV